MGHHPLHRDLIRSPAPAAGNGSGLSTEAVDLSIRGGLSPGVGHTSHAGTGEGDAVAVAAVGVGRKVHVVIVQPVHTAITADDRVIVPRTNPVVGGRRPVQIKRWSHRLRMAVIRRWHDGKEARPAARRRPHRFVGLFNRARR